jgi:uncharacterized membrane protein
MRTLWFRLRRGLATDDGFPREAKSKTKSVSGETPLDILKKRYAGGEITKDDFERMKKDLEV